MDNNENESPGYTVRNYDAVDQQVAEVARRERILSDKLVIANYFQMARVGLLVAAAISLIILAIGIAYWFAKDDCSERIITKRVIGHDLPNTSVEMSGKKA